MRGLAEYLIEIAYIIENGEIILDDNQKEFMVLEIDKKTALNYVNFLYAIYNRL